MQPDQRFFLGAIAVKSGSLFATQSTNLRTEGLASQSVPILSLVTRGYPVEHANGANDMLLAFNIGGVVDGVRTLLPRMLERGSRYIVNTLSIGGMHLRRAGQCRILPL